jgi:hypothetical protein
MSRIAAHVVDKDGKDHIIVLSTIEGIDYTPGKPAVEAKPAVEGKEADPGRPANGADPGKSPTPAVEAREAVEAENAVPPSTVIKYGGGSAELNLTPRQVLELVNG